MSHFIHRQTHALCVECRTRVPWRSLAASELARLLAAQAPWNLRPARRSEELVFLASLPARAELPERRLEWLTEQVEQAAQRLHDGAPPPLSWSTRPDSRAVLGLVRSVAEGKAWTVRGDAALELVPAEEATALRAIPEPDTVAVRSECAWPVHGSLCAESVAALAVAALGLNARFSAARLRLLRGERPCFVAECALPSADLCDDEVEFALEGVRHAAHEARRTLDCLAHAAVAREYAAALELSIA